MSRKGKEYFRLTEQAAKQTEADVFKKKHIALNEQLQTMKQIFVSNAKSIQDAEDSKDDDAIDHLWDSSMEESFVTEKELENFLKMRQYTTGVHEDGNSEINNVKNNDSSMETKDTNVFATAAVLCMEHSSLTLFIDVGGRRMIIFDPMRRDNERSHETPNAGFFSFFKAIQSSSIPWAANA